MSFAELGLADDLVRAVTEKGYGEPTPIQAEAIPQIIAGRDVIGSAQTGTGKTAAFALPILHRLGAHKGTRCLIIGPTRELAAQVEENFQLYGKNRDLQIALLHGGVGYGKQRQAIKDGADVLVATPGRLLDHVGQGDLSLKGIEILVMDEVDRMLDMGFIEDVHRIVRHCNKNRQTLLFSATIPEQVKKLASWALKDPVEVTIGLRVSPAETVRHVRYPVNTMQKFDMLQALLKKTEYNNVLICTRTRAGADRISRWMTEHGHSVLTMHSDLRQSDRTKALDQFKKGEVNILIATDIASRGLDIKNVTHVINYDVPQHAEDYVHRIGRTGRARSEGEAFTIVGSEELSLVDAIEKFIKQRVPRERLEGFDYWTEPNMGNTAPLRKRRNRGFTSGPAPFRRRR